MKIEGFSELFRFEGFIIDTITCSGGFVQIALHRDRRRKLSCPQCQHRMAFNKTIVREVYDLPIGTASCVKVVFETVQGKCSRCGHAKTFLPDEVDEKATATRRFMQYASALCRFMTASEAAAILPFSDDTIRRWDKAILEEQLGEVDLSNATKLLIDEKAIGQHHKYVTLVLDGDNGELLFMSPGKKSESLIPFFEKMPENTRRNVIAACMDRNAGYPNVVRKFCPNAEIVRLFGRSTGAINFTS